ncbi:MAG: AAA family ATPase [Butyricicoccaceae bacterium]
MKIEKIVITGGPCAGKSTALSWIREAFSRMGYTVLFVSETATELISGGVAPWTCGSNRDYQLCQISMQIEKERIYARAAQTMSAEKVLIVHDRGALDNKAYMTEAEFDGILKELNTNEVALRDSYGAVFHLVTAAKGAEEFYTRSNNAARTESPQQAAALDDRLIAAWTGHPHFRIIDNSTDFDQKMHRLIAEISSFLGEPEPMEIERKFLIRYPDLALLRGLPNCRRVEIIQTYLYTKGEEEIRVRQRGENGHFVYYKTTKRAISGLKRVEIEEQITQEEYLALLMQADVNCRPIRKDRYCLTYQSQYFEIDVYPFWKDRAILEIELQSEDAAIEFPDFIEVLEEVTEDERYKNRSLALLK